MSIVILGIKTTLGKNIYYKLEQKPQTIPTKSWQWGDVRKEYALIFSAFTVGEGVCRYCFIYEIENLRLKLCSTVFFKYTARLTK